MHRNFKFKIIAKINKNIHFKEILIGSSNTIVLKVGGMMLALVATLIISRQYGAETLGIYNLSVRTVLFLSVIGTLGFNVSILRYVGQFNNDESKPLLKILFKNAFQITIPASITLGIVLFVTSETISIKLFGNSQYTLPLKTFSVLLPIMSLLEISIQFIRGLKAVKVSEMLRSVVRPLVNISLLLIIGLFIYNRYLPIITFTIGVILSFIIALIYILNRIKNLEQVQNEVLTKNKMLKTSTPMFISSILLFLRGNLSTYFLEAYSTTNLVGIFSVTLRISALIGLFLIAVNTISAPKFSELYWSGKIKGLQGIIFSSSKLIFIPSIIFGILIIIFSKSILTLFGAEFISGYIAIFILVIGQIIAAASGSVGLFMNMSGHEKVLKNILFFSVPVVILLNYLIIPLYGIIGAASVYAFTIASLNVIAAIYIYKKLKLVTFYIPFISRAIINRTNISTNN